MRALQVCELTGPDGIRLGDAPEPSAGPGGALVEVYSVGVSYPDLLRSQGRYQERTEPPYVLGREFAGVVRSVPPGAGVAVGDRVAGVTEGAAAELVVADADKLLKLPSDMTFHQGAALLVNYYTAIVGLPIRGRMQRGESVLVHGAAGGAGTAAIQVAKALGGRVIAVASTDSKRQVALEAGADDAVGSDQEWREAALRFSAGRGVDIVYDPVGGDRALDTMRCLAPGGRWVVIGFVGGAIPQVALNRVLFRNIDIVGAYYGGYLANDPKAMSHLRDRLQDLMRTGFIRPPIGGVHRLEDGADALRELAERAAVGKVIVAVR
jgi:NADPH:quinone reductase